MQKLISTRKTRELFGGISAMTEWRRRRAGLLPPVIKINGRNFDVEPEIADIIQAAVAGAPNADVAGLVKKIVEARVAGQIQPT